MKASNADLIGDFLRFMARSTSRLGLKSLAARIYLLVAVRTPENTRNARLLCTSISRLRNKRAGEKLLMRFLDASHHKRCGKPHDLTGRLVVSLTSYPKRYATLHHTLRCLLNQSVRADRIVLWIAHQDRDSLPQEVLALQEQGLEIKFCEDLRSYKKILPMLSEEPNAFIVTADDDLYYPPHWLKALVASSQREPGRIIAFLAREVVLKSDGNPEPYQQWKNILAGDRPTPVHVFPIGAGGVLYPPGVFHASVGDFQTARKVAPNADDVWLYWMWRMNGGIACMAENVAGRKFYTASWPGSQVVALKQANLRGNLNDEQISNMVSHFGTEVFHPKPPSGQ